LGEFIKEDRSVKKRVLLLCVVFNLSILVGLSQSVLAQLKPGDPIVIGVPTALGAIEGKDSWMAAQMAVDEINAKGGVLVGDK